MASASAGLAGLSDNLTCFVCDGTVIGRYYNLASCKTQVTKQKLVEKLGQLVGEQYMVVISEEDIICRSCNTMLNNLDRLEKEMSSLRSVILRFLEKKYELDEGELADTKVVLPPPQNLPELNHVFKKTEAPIKFKERKKQSLEAQGQKNVNSNVWMQCDRCHYTTPYSSFMINHIHRHDETPPKSDEHSEHVQEPAEAQEGVAVQENADVEKTEPASQGLEVKGEVVSNGVSESEASIPTEGVEEVQEGEQQTGAAIVEMDESGTMCMVDENGMLQQVRQGEDGQFYVMEEDIDSSKQMLSVAEDGSVQMVQVMWDDIEADDNMHF